MKETNSLYFWGAIDNKVSHSYVNKLRYDEEGNVIIEDSANIMPVYFKISKPFEGDALPNKCEIVEFVTEVYRQSGIFDESFRKYLDALRNYYYESNSGGYESIMNIEYWYEPDLNFGEEGAKLIKEMLIHLGFDGIHFTEQNTSTYAIFRPNQVKSALGNNGEFSLTNNLITRE